MTSGPKFRVGDVLNDYLSHGSNTFTVYSIEENWGGFGLHRYYGVDRTGLSVERYERDLGAPNERQRF